MRIRPAGPLWMVINEHNQGILFVASGSASGAWHKARLILGSEVSDDDLKRIGYVVRQVRTIEFVDEEEDD